jgi:hypothetical protein
MRVPDSTKMSREIDESQKSQKSYTLKIDMRKIDMRH